MEIQLEILEGRVKQRTWVRLIGCLVRWICEAQKAKWGHRTILGLLLRVACDPAVWVKRLRIGIRDWVVQGWVATRDD